MEIRLNYEHWQYLYRGISIFHLCAFDYPHEEPRAKAYAKLFGKLQEKFSPFNTEPPANYIIDLTPEEWYLIRQHAVERHLTDIRTEDMFPNTTKAFQALEFVICNVERMR